ncbi:hypothetical protein MKL29_03875, partial [Streptococcus suis]|nr:hypothetical protein [Streptococcus suis]
MEKRKTKNGLLNLKSTGLLALASAVAVGVAAASTVTVNAEDFKVVYKLPNGSEQTQDYKDVSYDDFIVNALASADASKASYGDYDWNVSGNTHVFTFKGLAEAPKAEPTAAKEDFKVVYKLPNG